MTPERWAEIRKTFEGAIERPEKDRAAYLRVVCARDDELRREVETLLASHQESGDFLEKPAADLNRTMLSQNSGITSGIIYSGSVTLGSLADDTGEYQPGYRVGPYQLQRRIGKGGMGSVWLANRFDHEFNRTVAVKLVKRGMDTQEILRRFRMERQLLAGLDHPNIARLVDGGSTPEGLPYLVMEYVEGIPIDQYCQTRALPITTRLRLFRDVCAAVQYAHQNLVVHRDIKTGNILVTAEGVPKLLDFGIAKLLRTEFSTLAAAETRPELRPMTLDYASPEQVRGEPITTATDVYSLGVLLYKLLTGKFPYGLDSRNHAALQHAICNTEPLKPSAVVLTDTKFAIPQATQKLEVPDETRDKARRRLKKKLSGDLDMIILKALRKEPPKRYLSVEQFSNDVRRYLEGRPVIARGDEFSYRAGKFLRRNVVLVGASLFLMFMLLVSAVTSANFARETERQRQLAERQFRAAQEEAIRQQRELMDTYLKLGTLEAGIGNLVGAQTTYRGALDAARRFAQDHPEYLPSYSYVQRAALRLGDLAPPAEGFSLYKEALAQFDKLAAGSYQFGAADVVEALTVARRLGAAQFQRKEYLAALATFSRAQQIAEGAAARLPADANVKRSVAAANFLTGEVLANNGAPEAALVRLRKSFELYREIAGVQLTVTEATVRGYESALAEIAGKGSDSLRRDITTDLAAMAPAP